MSLVIAPVVGAADTLDQSQTIMTGSVAVQTTNWQAQTFTAGITGLLDRVDVLLSRGTSSFGSVAVQIRPVLPDGTPSSVLLATSPITSDQVPPNTFTWVSVPINAPAPVPVVAGLEYAIVLSAPFDNYQWGVATSDVYRGGKVLSSTTSGTTWLNGPASDADFKTYVDTGVPVVPEAPLAFLLPLAGLAVLGFGVVLTRWRRRRIALV